MREILFRGKTIRDAKGVITEKKYKKDIWVFGCISHLEYDPPLIEQKNGDPLLVDPETVGQFTGLTDKNGKKIFEGDILAWSNINNRRVVDGVVRYGEFNCTCCDGVYGWYVEGGDIRDAESNEVIGNIHDNPELLGGE